MKKIVFPLLLFLLFLPGMTTFAHDNIGWERVEIGEIFDNPIYQKTQGSGWRRIVVDSFETNGFTSRIYVTSPTFLEFTVPKSTDIEITYGSTSSRGESKVFVDGTYYGSFYSDGVSSLHRHFLIKELNSSEHRIRIENHPYTMNGGTGTYSTMYGIEYADGASIYTPITNLVSDVGADRVTLSWDKPTKNPDGIEIKRDGQIVATLPASSTSYLVEGLTPETEYEFTVTALYGGGKSDPETINITTGSPPPPQPAGEVKDIRTSATHERINLSWRLPESNILEHVNIYRGSESGESFAIMSAPVKIFETNGTYFNDLTVQPETTYNYRLTTYSTEGVESEGVATTVTTAEAPPPVIEGGSYTKDPLTGNFIYSWDSPTYGQVKILLGETEFSTVDASLGQVSIPKNQMKYTAFGDPDVTLIAIDGDKTSEPIRPGVDGKASGDTIDQLKIPFTAQDLLGTGTGLLWLIAPFVLLALAFLVVPKLRNMLFTAISGKSKTDEQVKDGRTVREGRTYRESAPERNIRVPREKVERQQREMRTPRQLRGERG